MTRPRVVIVGAGFAGLTCARALKLAPVDVLLVDRNNYHLFTPLLYQVATATLEPAEVARPVRQLIQPLTNADFRQAVVSGVEFEKRNLTTDHGPISYDYLVLAGGATSEYFGNPALAESTIGLKGLDEGLAFRNRIIRQFEESRWITDPSERRRLLTFAVVGGGPTGVEMAGAISELIRLVLRKDYRDLNLSEVGVVLLEAAPYLLSAFDPMLREAARASLVQKQVEVMLQAKVDNVTEAGILLSSGERIETANVLWTAGVRAADIGKETGLALGRQSRIKVAPTLQAPNYREVFVIGDMCGATDGESPLPMLIPVAMQEGKHVAANIASMVDGGHATAFQYKDPGIMATIGRNSGVAQLGRVKLTGFPGWVMWLTVHLVNVVTFRARIIVLINWAWDYLFYDKPIRLIVRAADKRARRAVAR